MCNCNGHGGLPLHLGKNVGTKMSPSPRENQKSLNCAQLSFKEKLDFRETFRTAIQRKLKICWFFFYNFKSICAIAVIRIRFSVAICPAAGHSLK